MKQYIFYFLITISVACGGRKEKGEVTPSDLREINDEIKNIEFDSLSAADTSNWNETYSKHNIIAADPSYFDALKGLPEFKEILTKERTLLNIWIGIENFPSNAYQKDSVNQKMIHRCSTLDRAPRNAKRTPAYRSLKAISTLYYQALIPIAFHIVARKDQTGILANMNNLIEIQMDSLNKTYSSAHIQFSLSSIDTTYNDLWFDSASYYINDKALNEMTSKLSINPATTMNVYLVGTEMLGEATYPWYEENGTAQDYVMINFQTLPGGPRSFYDNKYSEGNTLIHEVGHYLGLLHTFEGGNSDCQSSYNDGCKIGDQVDDTPAQKICYFDGCDDCNGSPCNSCDESGNDPVKNYMGYNPDACMNAFTDGQRDRIQRSILKYRSYFIINLQ